MKDQINVSSNSKISMPIFNLIGIIAMVGTVVLMYSSITQKITSLETSRELMLNDLLKASDQKPIDQEQFLIQESLAGDIEKTIVRVDEMMHNGVNIQRMMKDIDRLEKRLTSLEELTSLNMLELATDNFEVLDSAGLNRVKSGFFVELVSAWRPSN